MVSIIGLIIYGLLFGIITAYIAKTKNRNTNVAFILGFFLGIIATIGYLFLNKK